MTQLGHVVLYVRDLAGSARIYTDIGGLRQVGTLFNNSAAAFSGGRNHHELLLIEMGAAPGPLRGRRIGLYNIGWCVGTTHDDQRSVRDRNLPAGSSIDRQADHTVSQSH